MLHYDINHLLQLADTIAAAAVTFNSGQGYDSFLKARKDFTDEIDKLKQIDKILNADDIH